MILIGISDNQFDYYCLSIWSHFKILVFPSQSLLLVGYL